MGPRAPELRWWLVLAVATSAVVIAITRRGLDPDDLFVVERLGDSYLSLWSEPFLDRFYRPLVVTLFKVSVDLFGHNPLPLRLLQGALVVATVLVFLLATRQLDVRARVVGALIVLASPFTFVSIVPFAGGVADSIVGLALLVVLGRAVASEPRIGVVDVAALLVALAAKESGLVVAAVIVIAASRGRAWKPLAATVIIAVAYVLFRRSVVVHRQILFSTGFLFEIYSPVELAERFGHRVVVLYAYNVAANLLAVFFYIPHKGQLTLGGSVVPFALITTATSVLVGLYLWNVRKAARRFAPLLLVIAFNAVLGYAYVRNRVMFASYLIVALVVVHALHHRRDNRVILIAGAVLWSLVLASTVFRIASVP